MNPSINIGTKENTIFSSSPSQRPRIKELHKSDNNPRPKSGTTNELAIENHFSKTPIRQASAATSRKMDPSHKQNGYTRQSDNVKPSKGLPICTNFSRMLRVPCKRIFHRAQCHKKQVTICQLGRSEEFGFTGAKRFHKLPANYSYFSMSPECITKSIQSNYYVEIENLITCQFRL